MKTLLPTLLCLLMSTIAFAQDAKLTSEELQQLKRISSEKLPVRDPEWRFAFEQFRTHYNIDDTALKNALLQQLDDELDGFSVEEGDTLPVEYYSSPHTCLFLGEFPNDENVKQALREIISRENDPRWQKAMRSYLRLVGYRLDGFLKELVRQNQKFADDAARELNNQLFLSERDLQLSILDDLVYLKENDGYNALRLTDEELTRIQEDKLSWLKNFIEKHEQEKIEYLTERQDNFTRYLQNSSSDTYETYRNICIWNVRVGFGATLTKKIFVLYDKFNVSTCDSYEYSPLRLCVLKLRAPRLSWDDPEDVAYIDAETAKLEAFFSQPEAERITPPFSSPFSTQIAVLRAEYEARQEE